MALLNSPLFQVAENSGNRITLRSPQGHVAHVCVLEEDIVRVMVLPFGKLRLPRSWAIAPGADDLPVEGRDRFDLSGFSLPDFTLDAEPDRLVVTTAQLRVSITLAGLFCRWETRAGARPADAELQFRLVGRPRLPLPRARKGREVLRPRRARRRR